MPPPSPLAIATSSVQRLVKEEASYHKELEKQESRLQQLESSTNGGANTEDENAEFQLRQERAAIQETRAIFAPLRQRIANAVKTLEEQVEKAEEGEGEGGAANAEEIEKAKEVLRSAKAADVNGA